MEKVVDGSGCMQVFLVPPLQASSGMQERASKVLLLSF